MQAAAYKLPAGSGKTTHWAKVIANDPSRYPAEIYVPTLDMARAWEGLLRAENPNCRVRVMLGREQTSDTGQPMCQRVHEARQLSASGLAVFSNLCASNGPTGTCQHFQQCPHILQQLGNAEVLIYTHAHLSLSRGRLEQKNPRLVVIDESFFAKCCREVQIDTAQVAQSSSMPASVKNIVQDMHTALLTGSPLRMIQKKYRYQPGGIRGLIKALDALISQMLAMAGQIASAALPAEIGLLGRTKEVLKHLLISSRYQAAPQSIGLDQTRNVIECQILSSLERFKVPAKAYQPEIVVLDADASVPILEQFFSSVQLHELSLERKAHVVQCHSTLCSQTYLGLNGATPATLLKIQDVQQLVRQMSANHGKVLVVGQDKLVGNASKGNAGLLALPSNCDAVHFNALRGKDQWKDHDAVLVVGRNQPPVPAMEKLAKALFMKDPVPLQLTHDQKLIAQTRGYRMKDGTFFGVDTAVHPDHRVQAIIEQHRECETLQAIDRLRLVHADKPKHVVVLSNVPLDIGVDELLSWTEIINGSRLEQALLANGGTLPLAPLWLVNHYPQYWATEAAAKKDIQRELKKGLFSISTSIRKMSLLKYLYRLPGQKRWSQCLSQQRTVKKVQAELKRMVGKGVNVKPHP